MKKKFIFIAIFTVSTVITAFYFNTQLKIQPNSLNSKLLSLKSIEAIAAGETRCIVSSDRSKNVGYCRQAVDKSQGAVCVTPGFLELPDCYGHETY